MVQYVEKYQYQLNTLGLQKWPVYEAECPMSKKTGKKDIQGVPAQYGFTQYGPWFSTVSNRTKKYQFLGLVQFFPDISEKNLWNMKKVEKKSNLEKNQ